MNLLHLADRLTDRNSFGMSPKQLVPSQTSSTLELTNALWARINKYFWGLYVLGDILWRRRLSNMRLSSNISIPAGQKSILHQKSQWNRKMMQKKKTIINFKSSDVFDPSCNIQVHHPTWHGQVVKKPKNCCVEVEISEQENPFPAVPGACPLFASICFLVWISGP